MKKIRNFLLIFILVIFANSVNLHAATVMFGVKTWYAEWDSALGKTIGSFIHNYLESQGTANQVTIKPGSGYLAGPLIGFQSEDRKFSFSMAYMVWGAFEQSSEFTMLGDTTEMTQDLERKDLDLAGGYSINQSLKLFVGYKNMDTKSDITFNYSDGTTEDIGWYKTRNDIFSFGLGVAFPLSETMLLSGQLGLLYTKTRMTDDLEDSYDVEDSWGLTGEVALSTLLSENLVGQLGLKYQRFTLKINDPGIDSTKTDQFLGITISILYMFDTSGA